MPPRRYYFRSTDGSSLGPFNLNIVAEMIRADKVKANTPVSLDGQDFKPMKSFPELATLLSVETESDIPGLSDDDIIESTPLYSGSFTEVSLPKLLYHFIAAKVTGRLLVSNQVVKKELFLVNGKLVAAISNLKRDRLGQHLLRKGVISQDQLDDILDRASNRDERLGEYLIQNKVVEPHELFVHLSDQLKEKVYEVFSWRVGSYAFYEGQEYKGSILPMNQNPWELISEGVRQGYELPEFETLFEQYLDYVLLKVENKTLHINQLDLHPLELKVFKAASSQRALRDILARDGGDEKKDKVILGTIYMGLELELLTFGEKYESVQDLPGDSAAAAEWDLSMTADDSGLQAEGDDLLSMGILATPPVSRQEQKLLEKLNKIKEQDFFERLGLERTASSSDVSRSFLDAARIYHPDQIPGDIPDSTRDLYTQIFSLLNEAHQKLSDDKARSDYLEALESGLDDSQVDVGNIIEAENCFQRGEVLLGARKYEQALGEFEKAIQLNPDEGEFHIYRGYAGFMSNTSSDSAVKNHCINTINTGLKMRGGEVAMGFLFLGRIYKAGGDKEMSVKMFKKAVNLDRGLVEASRELRLMSMRSEKKGLFRRK